ncbi:hypothetical protein HK405_008399, partial [Cladochytrium tenue]
TMCMTQTLAKLVKPPGIVNPVDRWNTQLEWPEDSILFDGEPTDSEFPWSRRSVAPATKLVLTGFKDYHAQASIGTLVNSRLHEGFRISNVRLVSRSAPEGIAESFKLDLELTRHWLPTVCVVYTIRAHWVPSRGSLLDIVPYTVSASSKTARRRRLPKIKMAILADLDFIIAFFSVPSASDSKPDRCTRLRSNLARIVEMDELSRAVSSFVSPAVLSAIPRIDIRALTFTGNSGSNVIYAASPESTSVWHLIAQIVVSNAANFSESEVDVLLHHSNPLRAINAPGSGSSAHTVLRVPSRADRLSQGVSSSTGGNADFQGTSRSFTATRLPSAVTQLIGRLSGTWCSMALNWTTFIKLHDPANGGPPGFVVLRLFFETEYLLSIWLTFFNIHPKERSSTVADIEALVSSIHSSSNSGPRQSRQQRNQFGAAPPLDAIQSAPTQSFSTLHITGRTPLIPCKKPIRRLLIKYNLKATDDTGDEFADSRHRAQSSSSVPPLNDPLALVGAGAVYATFTRAVLSGSAFHLAQQALLGANATSASPSLPTTARTYLSHARWVWLADVDLKEFSPEALLDTAPSTVMNQALRSGRRSGGGGAGNGGSSSGLLPPNVLAFQHLYRTRLAEGFALVAASHDSLTLYAERTIPRSVPRIASNSPGESAHNVVVSLQYIVLLDRVQHTVVTELWAEPISDPGVPGLPPADAFDRQAGEILAIDRKLFETLYTFDRILNLTRPPDVGVGAESSTTPAVDEEEDLTETKENWPPLPQPFHAVPATYRLSSVMTGTTDFACRVFACMDIAASELAVDTNSTQIRTAVNPALPSTSTSQAPTAVGPGPLRRFSLAAYTPGASGARTASPPPALLGHRGSVGSDSSPLAYRTDRLRGAADSDGSFSGRGSTTSDSRRQSGSDFNAQAAAATVGNIAKNDHRTLARTFLPRAFIAQIGLRGYRPIPTETETMEVFRSLASRGLVSAHPPPRDPGAPSFFRNLNAAVEDAGLSGVVHEPSLSDGCCFCLAVDPAHLVLLVFPSEQGGFHFKLASPGYLAVAVVAISRLGAIVATDFAVQEDSYDAATAAAKGRLYFDGDVAAALLQGTALDGSLLCAAGPYTLPPSPAAAQASAVTTIDDSVPNEPLTDSPGCSMGADDLTAAFGAAITQTAFLLLNLGASLSDTDLHRALQECDEFSVDVDLTELLNLMALLRRANVEVDSELADLQIKFSSILSRRFKAVSEDADQSLHAGVYFFNRAGSPSVTEGSVYESPDRLAAAPLFLRTDCSLRKSSLGDPESVGRTVTCLPTSYRVDGPVIPGPEGLIYTDAVDFTPHVIGTQDDPLGSEDGTVATIHFVCMTLAPVAQYHDRMLSDRFEEQNKSSLEDLSMALTEDAKDAVQMVVYELNALIRNVVLRGLLLLDNPYENAVAKKAWDLMRLSDGADVKSCPTVDHLSAELLDNPESVLVSVPLAFVKPRQSLARLPDELESRISKTSEFAARRLGSLLRIVPANGQAPTYWLLISIEQRPAKAEIAFFTGQSNTVGAASVTLLPLYHLIISSIERLNKIILLETLSKTRYASPYLIPPPNNGELDGNFWADEPSDDDDDGSASPQDPSAPEEHFTFRPGQKALNGVLMSGSLSQLRVANRKNLFVLAGPSIYYIYVGLQASDVPQSLDFSPDLDGASPLSGRTLYPERPKILAGGSNSAGGPQPAESIIVQFYGVDPPPQEVTSEIVKLVEMRLNSIILDELHGFLSRASNTTRLTMDDVAILLPVKSSPSFKAFFNLGRLHDPALFLALLRAVVTGSGFNSLAGNAVVGVLQERYTTLFGLEESEPAASANRSIRLGDLSFIFLNAKAPAAKARANSRELASGVDLASLCFALVLPSGKIARSIKSESPKSAAPPSSVSVPSEPPRRVDDAQDGSFNLLAESWLHETKETGAIATLLTSYILSAFYDYSVEVRIQRATDMALRPSFESFAEGLDDDEDAIPTSSRDSLSQPSSRYSEMHATISELFDFLLNSSFGDNPCVQRLQSSIHLPEWIAADFRTELREQLSDVTGDPLHYLPPLQDPGNFDRMTGPGLADSDGSFLVAGLNFLAYFSETPLDKRPDMTSSFVEDLVTTPPMDSLSLTVDNSDGNVTAPSRLLEKRLIKEGSNIDVSKRNGRLFRDPLFSQSGDPVNMSCFLIAKIESNQIAVVTYNWSRPRADSAFSSVLRCISWNNIRMQYFERQVHSPAILSPQIDNTRSLPEHAAGFSYSSSFGDMSAISQRLKAESERTDPRRADEFRKQYHGDSDAIQREAVEFLDWFVRQLRAPAAKPYRLAVPSSASWHVATQTAAGPDRDDVSISTASLAAIFRSVRVHFLKYPQPQLSATDRDFRDVDDFAIVSTRLGAISQNGPPESPTALLGEDWQAYLIESYLHRYAEYLRSVGLEVLDRAQFAAARSSVLKQSRGLGITPSGSIASGSGTTSLRTADDVPPIYAKRDVPGGVLLVQAGADSGSFYVTLYSIRLEAGTSTGRSLTLAQVGGESDLEADLRKESMTLKSALHLNSCRRGVYARSRLVGGQFTRDVGSLTLPLVQYILRNPGRYGGSPIAHSNDIVACYFSSRVPDFADPSASAFQPGPLRYSLVVYFVTGDDTPAGAVSPGNPATVSTSLLAGKSRQAFPRVGTNDSTATTAHARSLGAHLLRAYPGDLQSAIRLKYYLFIVNEVDTRPLSAATDNLRSTPSFADHVVRDAAPDYVGDGCYLADVVGYAEKRIDELINQAVSFHGRDNLWRSVLRSEDGAVARPATPATPAVLSADWARIFLDRVLLPNARPVSGMDRAAAALLGDTRLPWRSLLSGLARAHATNARCFADDDDGAPSVAAAPTTTVAPPDLLPHLLLFNPAHQDYLLHFELLAQRDAADTAASSNAAARIRRAAPAEDPPCSVALSSVSREGVADDVEYRHVADVVVDLSYLLWRDVLDDRD